MSIKRVKITKGAIPELMKGPEVAADLAARANRIADAAGAQDHEVVKLSGRDRARVSVVTATFEARRAESRSRQLSRSIDAGR